MEKERTRIRFSGSTLKIIAIVSMLIDHVGAGIIGRYLSKMGLENLVIGSGTYEQMVEWLTEYGTPFLAYFYARILGRIAFPIFCFLLVEGYFKTKNVNKYLCRLGLFALLSEIPFDLFAYGTAFYFGYQNVFFTLFIGLAVLIALDYALNMNGKKTTRYLIGFVAVVVGCLAALVLQTDYNAYGIICIVVLYLFHNNKRNQTIAGCAVFALEVTAPLAFFAIWRYNGERGLKMKYFFYAFYPVHLLIIYLICVVTGLAGYSAM